jgi:hypothetical protein
MSVVFIGQSSRSSYKKVNEPYGIDVWLLISKYCDMKTGGAARRVYAMKLLDYMKSLDKPQLEVFAAACPTTVGQLRQVAYGRRASAELAMSIDRATKGAVTCETLRPDIDWQYLRGQPSTQAA